MARRTNPPGRTLAVFFIVLAITYGLVALAGVWKPVLGLDLQGGTSIRLTAKGSPSAAALDQARGIIDQRVNGSGVTEASVTVEGTKYVIVQIPGKSRRDLVETVERQAQLRFRLVACSDVDPGPCAGGTTTPGSSATTTPGTGVTAPSPTPSSTGTASGSPSSTASTTSPAAPSSSASGSSTAGNNRAVVPYGLKPTKKPSSKPSASGRPKASPTSTPTSTATSSTSGTPTSSQTSSPTSSGSPSPATPTSTASGAPIEPPTGGKDVADPLTWQDSPNQEAIDAYNAFTCPTDGSAVPVVDDPDKPLVTCGTGDSTGIKYLLSAAAIEGTELDSADAEQPQNSLTYVVALDFNGSATKVFAKISQKLLDNGKQFAIVLDGQVISAPGMQGLILNGQAQIEGSFTRATAQSLALSLKYGALPVAFESDPTVETIGPSLAGDQLTAGITAGIVGLLLVMIYCLLYYRGLGIVVIGSLLIAGAATYAMVLLLAKTAGFTLTLPGIAGLIVAVGITGDSFIVYFERIRDEMRDGRTMKVAVEAGWIRARATCVAADSVSLLAAVVLYIFAAGVVKGFAFALGLSTVIDLVVFFFFTKPLVSLLARRRFFSSGHRLSGLDAEALGVDKLAVDRPRTGRISAGGRA